MNKTSFKHNCFILFNINQHITKGLVTNYGEGGGATKREGGGGHVNFYLAEGGAQKVLG